MGSAHTPDLGVGAHIRGPRIGPNLTPFLAKSMDSTRENGLKTWNRIWPYFGGLGPGPQIWGLGKPLYTGLYRHIQAPTLDLGLDPG